MPLLASSSSRPGRSAVGSFFSSSGDRCSGNGGGGMRFVQILLLPPLFVFSSRSISSMPPRSGSSCSGSGSTGLREHRRRGCQPRRVSAAAITALMSIPSRSMPPQ